MNQESVYTSTGIKLLHHTNVIASIKKYGIAKPISLQLAPTSRCNLNCSFCSNANRVNHEELPIEKVITLLRDMTDLGLRTVEWTGGGEPLLYSQLKVGILSANVLGLKQGLITNGLLLKTLSDDILSKLSWIRVSMNCLDYVDKITLPKFKGTLGFSYVMNDRTTSTILDSLKRYTATYLPSYVRIVPNCQASSEIQELNNLHYSQMVESWGFPFFYQAKHFSTPENCYWGYLKPFVLHNGWVYPCSSVVLNEDSDKSFHSKYQWIRMEDITQLYRSSMFGRQWGCTHCVFRTQNDLVDSILNPKGMEEFV